MSLMPASSDDGVRRRPTITYENGEFRHNGVRCRIVFRRDVISIGCTDITVECAKKLLQAYEQRFEEVVYQYGEEEGRLR